MNKKIVVITHKNCPDGFTAAWVSWTKFKNKADYIGEYPGQKNLSYTNKLENKDVYIFDISFPLEFLQFLEKIVNKLVVIDHHPNSCCLDKFKSKDFVFDSKYSAAYLCWKYFYPKKKVPLFIQLISDNDTGTWKLQDSKELTMYMKYRIKLKLKESNFNKVKELLHKSKLNKALEIARIFREYEQELINKIAKIAVPKQWRKYKVLLANANVPQLGGKIATQLSEVPGIDIGIVYRRINDDEILFTMRSNNKKVDLNKIAKKYGSGGHPGAASFTIKKDSKM